MLCIDANIILRYILEDHTELSPKAKDIISENIVETPIEVLCEVVFVLTRIYNIARKDIADTLLDFYESTNCILPHREAVIKGIEYFGNQNLDFVDCLLAGYYETENTAIQTFDTKLEKLLEIIAKTKD
ncbi:MAG: PIN domain-containing protein [Treponema sp.]|jgi:predicted nucleic-acid-binding protein|nr:PIN domain-containing protein [Treponema sp.]